MIQDCKAEMWQATNCLLCPTCCYPTHKKDLTQIHNPLQDHRLLPANCLYHTTCYQMSLITRRIENQRTKNCKNSLYTNNNHPILSSSQSNIFKNTLAKKGCCISLQLLIEIIVTKICLNTITYSSDRSSQNLE